MAAIAAFLALLNGKKTYIMCAAGVVKGCYDIYTGNQSLGATEIIGALTAAGMRSGIAAGVEKIIESIETGPAK